MKYVILAVALLVTTACTSISRDTASDVDHAQPLPSEHRAN